MYSIQFRNPKVDYPPPYSAVVGISPVKIYPDSPNLNYHHSEVSSSNFEVICIGLSRKDRIELIGFKDQGLIDRIRNALIDGCGSPIKNVEYSSNSVEFKMSGNPWSGISGDSVGLRRLLTNVLICMAQRGWNLIQSVDVCKSQWDKDTLYFTQASHPDPEPRMFVLSFNMSDRIRLIDCDELYPVLRKVVSTHWRYGIGDEKHYSGSSEIKLNGSPFDGKRMGTSGADAKFLLCKIIQAFRSKGYKLYASCDTSVGHKGRDLESWVFRKITPFYH